MRKPSAITIMALVLALTGCGGENGEESSGATTTTLERYTVTGRLILHGNAPDEFVEVERAGIGVGCVGSGGYDDIEAGLEVTIRDERDAVVGDGALSEGSALADGCAFDFKVSDLPRANFYKVKVGNRGEQNYSFEAMKASGWSVSLTLD